MIKKYNTSKWTAAWVVIVGAIGYAIAIFGNPHGFQINFVTLLLIAIIVYLLFDSLYGTYVTTADQTLTRVDNFFMKKKIRFGDIESINYQPTYGVGKEASTLLIFPKGAEKASITMTSIWFTEPVLKQILKDLKVANPAIRLDEEAQHLLST